MLPVSDKIMCHDPKCATFNNAYINEKVQFHLQNVFLDESTEDRLIGMLSQIGHVQDPRQARIWSLRRSGWRYRPIQRSACWRLRGHSTKAADTASEARKMRRVLTSLISRKRAHRDKAILQEYRAH